MSRADEVRKAKMTAKNLDTPQVGTVSQDEGAVRPNSWFVYVMPTQTGVEMIGAGRYGYWDERPNVYTENNCVRIVGKEEDDPIFIAPKASVVSIHVAQAKHIEASPFPVVEVNK